MSQQPKPTLTHFEVDPNAPRWYVVQVRSRYEDVATTNIRSRLETFGLQDSVEDILAPSRMRKRVLRGKTKDVEEKVYPGYIFIKAILSDDLKNVIRSTEYVKGFVGGVHPTPLAEKEIKDIIETIASKTDDLHSTDLETGDIVNIIDGPFSGLQGKLGEVNIIRGRVRVLISMFGRETPVELEFFQVERVL